MQYLTYATKEQAQSRSAQEAINRGCSVDSVTSYWWSVIEHPTSGEAALAISDPSTLTETEQSMLVSKEYLEAEGWFPVDEGVV